LTDGSLKPDPQRKGSYYRRIEDIDRALQRLDVTRLPSATQFLVYFFACEKLAHGLVGIKDRRPAAKAYHHKNRLCLKEIRAAAAALNLPVAPNDLDCLFADHNEQHLLGPRTSVRASARVLRNTLTHDFGPTNAQNIVEHAAILIPKMINFLDCAKHVLAFQRATFGSVP
jgi:hypothetical protein